MQKVKLRQAVVLGSVLLLGRQLAAADDFGTGRGTLAVEGRSEGPRSASSDNMVSAPVLGYVYQSSSLELRAILGVPGSAVFSDRLPLPESVTHVHVAPSQTYMLVERRDDDTAVVRLSGEN